MTRQALPRRLARALGFLTGVALGCPLTYVGFVLGGSWGVQLFELAGAKESGDLALITGSVLTGAAALLLAYGLAIGLTRILEKAFGHFFRSHGPEPQEQSAAPRP